MFINLLYTNKRLNSQISIRSVGLRRTVSYGDTHIPTHYNMAENDLRQSTTTDISVPDFIVEAKALDVANDDKTITFHYYDKAKQNYGYYFSIPEIYSAANSLATWSVGKGWTTDDRIREAELDHVTGLGTDTFDEVMWNHEVVKLIVGDAFLEVIMHDGILINLINISPERVRVAVKGSRIQHYEIWDGGKWKKKERKEILHSMNKRVGDQIHGTSQIDATQWVIDARNEALQTNRMIEKRGRALGIVYYKTTNEGKIEFANKQIEKAVENGQMLGLPEDTAKIEPFISKSLSERMDWIRYLENFFYQTFGVPRSIATSDGTTEVGGINGHLIFEPIYAKEQTDLEGDLWGQTATQITFNRPPSLAPQARENAEKNTGQTTIQPAEVGPQLNR